MVADNERIYVAGRTHVYGFEPVHKHKAKPKKHKPKRHRRP